MIKIKQDGELLPSMFRAEAQFRNKCKDEKEQADKERDLAIKKLNQI